MTNALGNLLTDLVQSATMILILVSILALTRSVSLLRRAVHVQSASRFTEHLTNQTIAALREDRVDEEGRS